MSTLTTAELAAYPGHDPVERLSVRLGERAHAPTPETAPAGAPRPRSLARTVDIRRFPGRDRTDRIAHWIRAHVPLAESWSEDSLADVARRLAATARVIE